MTFSLNAWVNSVCWSPSNRFCFASTHDSIITVIDVAGNKKESIYLNHSPALSIVCLSDDEILAICYDRHIYKYKLNANTKEW
jgi:hypothetical protein